jgi:sortase (surface protein transpeptidase)
VSNLRDFSERISPQAICHQLAQQNAQIQSQIQAIGEAYADELKKHRQRLRDRNRLRRQLDEQTSRTNLKPAEEVDRELAVQQLQLTIATIDVTEPPALKKYWMQKQILAENLRVNDSQIRQFLLGYAQTYLN